MLEIVYLLGGSVLSVVIGTWLIGEMAPEIRRTGRSYELMYQAEMKHNLQRSAIRWLSILAASVVGSYKLKDVVDLIIEAIR